MEKNFKDLLETVIFIKDYIVTNMATKEEVQELRSELREEIQEVREELQEFRQEVKAEFMGIKNRVGAIDNRIDDESAKRINLESRIRTVVPNLPATPDRV